jgi:hypothetical protein
MTEHSTRTEAEGKKYHNSSTQWKSKHLPFFITGQKRKKNEVLKRDLQIILILCSLPSRGAKQRLKKSQNDSRIKLQNFVFYNLDQ